MTVEELFDDAQKGNHVDLIALIMFLVFEKNVLQLDDPADKLKLYYLSKHRERMNKELNAYKEQMNIKYDPQVYQYKDQAKTTYILAVSKKQADYIAHQNLIKTNDVRFCHPGELMHYNGANVTLQSIVEGRSSGVIGGY